MLTVTPYREPAEMPEEPKMSKPWPVWFSPMMVAVLAVVGAGAAIDGCAMSAWHGVFGSCAVACGLVTVAAVIVAIDRADRASKKS